jgi:hypothetical protein
MISLLATFWMCGNIVAAGELSLFLPLIGQSAAFN